MGNTLHNQLIDYEAVNIEERISGVQRIYFYRTVKIESPKDIPVMIKENSHTIYRVNSDAVEAYQNLDFNYYEDIEEYDDITGELLVKENREFKTGAHIKGYFPIELKSDLKSVGLRGGNIWRNVPALTIYSNKILKRNSYQQDFATIGEPLDPAKVDEGEQTVFRVVSVKSFNTDEYDMTAYLEDNELNILGTNNLGEYVLENMNNVKEGVNNKSYFTFDLNFMENPYPENVTGEQGKWKNGFTLNMNNYALLGSVEAKGKMTQINPETLEEVDTPKIGNLTLKVDESLIPMKVTPYIQGDKVNTFFDYFDYDYALPLFIAKQFEKPNSVDQILGDISDQLNYTKEFFNSFSTYYAWTFNTIYELPPQSQVIEVKSVDILLSLVRYRVQWYSIGNIVDDRYYTNTSISIDKQNFGKWLELRRIISYPWLNDINKDEIVVDMIKVTVTNSKIQVESRLERINPDPDIYRSVDYWTNEGDNPKFMTLTSTISHRRVDSSGTTFLLQDDDVKLFEDMLQITAAYRDNFARLKVIDDQTRMGHGGYLLKNIANQNLKSILDGMISTHIMNNPAVQLANNRLSYLQAFTTALTTYFETNWTIGESVNGLHKVSLPWYLELVDKINYYSNTAEINLGKVLGNVKNIYVLPNVSYSGGVCTSYGKIKMQLKTLFFRDNFGSRQFINPTEDIKPISNMPVSSPIILQTNRKLVLPELPEILDTVEKPTNLYNVGHINDVRYMFYTPYEDEEQMKKLFLGNAELSTKPLVVGDKIDIPEFTTEWGSLWGKFNLVYAGSESQNPPYYSGYYTLTRLFNDLNADAALMLELYNSSTPKESRLIYKYNSHDSYSKYLKSRYPFAKLDDSSIDTKWEIEKQVVELSEGQWMKFYVNKGDYAADFDSSGVKSYQYAAMCHAIGRTLNLPPMGRFLGDWSIKNKEYDLVKNNTLEGSATAYWVEPKEWTFNKVGRNHWIVKSYIMKRVKFPKTTMTVVYSPQAGDWAYTYKERETMFNREEWRDLLSIYNISTGIKTLTLSEINNYKINSISEINIKTLWNHDISLSTMNNGQIKIKPFNVDDETIINENILIV